MNKRARIALMVSLSFLGLLVIGTGAFLVWATNPQAPSETALLALQGSSKVSVESLDDGSFVFRSRVLDNTQSIGAPEGSLASTARGLVFYPGAHVDYRAYASLCQDLAEVGVTVVLVPMPLNFAIFNKAKALEIVGKVPGVGYWWLAGHSLGGAMAADFLSDPANAAKFEGLVLLGSYSASDLSKSRLKVLSVSADHDGLSTPDKIKDNAKNLPPDAKYVVLQGGNHAQFGSYGLQGGDGQSSITPLEQRRLTVQAITDFLR